MKQTAFFILLIIISFNVKTQSTKSSEKLYSIEWLPLEPAKDNIKISIQFDNIEVYDLRYDTSNIGLLKSNPGSKIKALNIQLGLASGIKYFYENYINKSARSGISLICLIKKLFLSNSLSADFSEEEKLNSSKYYATEISGIIGRIEFYACRNNIYYPLVRFDTIIKRFEKINEYAQKYVNDFLTSAFNKLKTLNWAKIKNSRQISEEELKNSNSELFNLPILNESFRKGLYHSFNEFKMNNPVDKPFVIKKENGGGYIYMKDIHGEDSLLTKLWGYSDGEDIYIYSVTNYYKLYRSNNGFIFYGAKHFEAESGLSLSGVSGYPNSIKPRTTTMGLKRTENYLQIDMYNGEIY